MENTLTEKGEMCQFRNWEGNLHKSNAMGKLKVQVAHSLGFLKVKSEKLRQKEQISKAPPRSETERKEVCGWEGAERVG